MLQALGSGAAGSVIELVRPSSERPHDVVRGAVLRQIRQLPLIKTSQRKKSDSALPSLYPV